ncbi:MAG: S24/S26 family peptidase [Clostridia bacterium]|nr:S24/S26 family peptidase [Clostridia bacterium]
MMKQTDGKRIEASMLELSPVLAELIRSGAAVRLTVTGNSMYPMLRDREDTVIIKACSELRRLDVPLYIRDNGQLVLHRMIGKKKGTYTMCGDNQLRKETGITKEQIIGVVESFVRKGKTYSCTNRWYRLYAHLWVPLRKIRPLLLKWGVALRSKQKKRQDEK